jgi:nucleoside-diphosphate-sugar epimerase
MKLLFGYGYLGSRVATLWRDAGNDVTVVTRSADKADQLAHDGFSAIVADVTNPATLANLPVSETVLFAVGFDRGGSQSIHDVYAWGVANVLAALPPATGRLIYISTTGVYGDPAGEWIDEQTPPDPQRPGGAASLATELAITEHPLGDNAVVLRLAGIYGPGRVPFLDALKNGVPIAAPQHGHLNLIHVDDAATSVLAAERADADGVYCVSDGQPAVRGDFYREVARLIGAAEPTFIEPHANSPRAARAASDKRIRNDRMLSQLRVGLRYPSFREGLSAILTVPGDSRCRG